MVATATAVQLLAIITLISLATSANDFFKIICFYHFTRTNCYIQK